MRCDICTVGYGLNERVCFGCGCELMICNECGDDDESCCPECGCVINKYD